MSLRFFFKTVLRVSALFGASCAFAYDPITHDLLTRASMNKSVVMESDFMTNLGLAGAGDLFPEYSAAPPVPIAMATVLNSAAYGSMYEDSVPYGPPFVGSVAFNHFFDPQWNGGVGRPLTIPGALPGVLGVSNMSPDWALEFRGNSYPEQFYSFAKAQDKLYTALTAATPSERRAAFGRVFQSLGHMVHHIQDMAQPQHVRNEDHCDLPFCPSGGRDEFEAVAREKITQTYLNGLLQAKNYPIPKFSRASDYWFSPVSAYSGMADFTAKNYVTYETGYKYVIEGGQGVVKNLLSEFPLPNGINPSNQSKKVLVPKVMTVTDLRTHASFNGSVKCVVGEVYDSYYTPATAPNQLLACSKFMSVYSPSKLILDWNHPEIFEAQHAILLPRAVAFGAGLINHFFEGKFDLVGAGGNNWILTNRSDAASSGVYSVFYENDAGIRNKISDFSIALVKDSSAQLTFELPANSSKLIVAFRGSLGSESSRVHGRVITLPKADTSVSISANPASVEVGKPVTILATISGNSPGGTVQFKVDGVASGAPVAVNSNAQAALTTSSLTQTTHTIVAEYSGDFRNKPNSSSMNLVVVPVSVPCGTPLTADGGSEGLVRVMDMGGTPGNVQVRFDAYSIPDGLQIKATGSGRILVDTGGLISGERSFTFPFDPNQNSGARTIEYKVTGNSNPGTAWSILSSCPGQSVADFPRYKLTFGVNYATNTQTCGAWHFWLDNPGFSGSPTGIINYTGSKSVNVSGKGYHLLKAVFIGSCPSGIGYSIGSPYYNTGKANVNFANGNVAVIAPLATTPGGQAN